MKRALLIAGGTISGLGAVLAITPPELGSSGITTAGSLGGGITSSGATTTAEPAASTTTTATATKSPTPTATQSAKATKSATATATKSATAQATASASASATPTKSATPTASATKATTGVSGTFTGDSFQASRFGVVTTRVTFTNGKITSVSASQSPSSWSQQSLSALIPYVQSDKITVAQIKQYSAEQLPCAISNSCNSRASYTATAFWNSIKTAIAKANA